MMSRTLTCQLHMSQAVNETLIRGVVLRLELASRSVVGIGGNQNLAWNV